MVYFHDGFLLADDAVVTAVEALLDALTADLLERREPIRPKDTSKGQNALEIH